ncbi:hypothetical protein D3C78_1062220 [compost metagenome]
MLAVVVALPRALHAHEHQLVAALVTVDGVEAERPAEQEGVVGATGRHDVIARAADEGHLLLVALQVVVARQTEQPVAVGAGHQRITVGIAIERVVVSGQVSATEQALVGDAVVDVLVEHP